jgi:hypothetical protein
MPRTACSKLALPLLVIATLSLTACATAPFRSSIVCPPVAAYDRAFQARLADEIQLLPPGAALERAMLDYGRLRDQARACHSDKETLQSRAD